MLWNKNICEIIIEDCLKTFFVAVYDGLYPAFRLWKEIYGKSMYSEVVALSLSWCKVRAEFCLLFSGTWLYFHSFSFHLHNIHESCMEWLEAS